MNDETDKKDSNPSEKPRTGIGPWVVLASGAAIKWIFLGFGVATVSHMITGSADGWRYWAASALCIATYALGAVIEFAGEFATKKERK